MRLIDLSTIFSIQEDSQSNFYSKDHSFSRWQLKLATEKHFWKKMAIFYEEAEMIAELLFGLFIRPTIHIKNTLPMYNFDF